MQEDNNNQEDNNQEDNKQEDKNRSNLILGAVASILFIFIVVNNLESNESPDEDPGLSNPQVVSARAIDAAQKFQTQKAYELFNRLMELAPNHPEYLYNNGVFRRSINDFDGAVAMFQKSIEMSQGLYVAPLFERAKILTLQGKLKDAEKTLLQTLKVAQESEKAPMISLYSEIRRLIDEAQFTY